MNLFENNNGLLTNSTGKKALRSILDGIYVNPEEQMLARTALNSGLSELRADPFGKLQADSIKRVLGGSQLAEDMVSAKAGFKQITRPSLFSSGGNGGFLR